ncbi:hypothetical protein AX14_010432 [Amanita brunnescens Koide BX004]|nr:hypothetical protein AX14_010432 [Amanita brunnescens Koide BX004]
MIVSYLLLCPPCARGKQKSDGIIDPDVLEHFHETWFSIHDDIRWFFLRDAATLLNSTPPKSHLHLPSNLLSILLGTKPPKPKYVKKKPSPDGIYVNEPDDDDDELMEDGEANQDEGDDWRKFFDEPSPDDAQSAGSSQPRARLHTLTIHQSLHPLASHRAVFTRAWLTLLPPNCPKSYLYEQGTCAAGFEHYA